MRAIVVDHYGSPDVLRVAELESPRPMPGELLVRVRAAALNPKDVMIRKGRFSGFTGRRFPQLIGHDFAGTVVACPSGELSPGTRVMGMLGGFRRGAYAELIVARESEVARAPESASWDEAAAIPLAGLTALQALRDVGSLRPGHRVLINGASGGVGSFAIQVAKRLGAEVITLSSERNRELCRELGADEARDYAAPNALTGLPPLDVAFDIFGNQRFEEIRALLGPLGTMVHTVPRAGTLWRALMTTTARKRSKLVVVQSDEDDLAYLRRLVEAGAVRPVIDRAFPLEEVGAAHRYLETKRARGKVTLRV